MGALSVYLELETRQICKDSISLVLVGGQPRGCGIQHGSIPPIIPVHVFLL